MYISIYHINRTLCVQLAEKRTVRYPQRHHHANDAEWMTNAVESSNRGNLNLYLCLLVWMHIIIARENSMYVYIIVSGCEHWCSAQFVHILYGGFESVVCVCVYLRFIGHHSSIFISISFFISPVCDVARYFYVYVLCSVQHRTQIDQFRCNLLPQPQ